MKKKIIFIALSLIIAGCSVEPKTVEYYKTHPVERAAVLAKYKQSPGKYKNDPDVINAIQAEWIIQAEKNKFVKPVNNTTGAGLFKLK